VLGIALLLVEAEGLDSDASSDLLRDLGVAISTVTGNTARVDDSVWSTCSDESTCVFDAGARMNADHVVLAKIYGARTKVLLIAELFRLEDGIVPGPQAQATLAFDQRPWDRELTNLARTLFAETATITAKLPPRDPLLPPAPIDDGPPLVAPIVLYGASAVALGLAIGFGVSSASAHDRLMTGAHFDSEIDSLESRMKTHSIVANVMYGTAGASAIAATAILIFW
jgi:hypothetical protein